MYFSRLLVLHLRISMLDQYGHHPSTLFHALLACTMDHSINDYILEVEFEADIMTKAAEIWKRIVADYWMRWLCVVVIPDI